MYGEMGAIKESGVENQGETTDGEANHAFSLRLPKSRPQAMDYNQELLIDKQTTSRTSDEASDTR